MPQRFRSNTEVLVRLATAFYENRSLKKTYLHFVSRTTWRSFLKYLDWLLSKEYIEYKTYDGEELYCLTESGREMFNVVLQLKEHVSKSKSVVA